MTARFIRFLHYIKKFILLFLFVTVVAQQCAASGGITGPVPDFSVKKKEAKEAFLGFYYDLVKRDHFSNFYSNNLIISTNIDYNFPENGLILLMLIEELRNDDNVASRFLLGKLKLL